MKSPYPRDQPSAQWFDYKSDVLDDDPRALKAHVDEHYRVQAELYALAAAKMLGLAGEQDRKARFGGLLYWFVRPGRIVHVEPSWDDLEAFAASLARREYT